MEIRLLRHPISLPTTLYRASISLVSYHPPSSPSLPRSIFLSPSLSRSRHPPTHTHTGLWGTSPSTSHGNTIGVNIATRNARVVHQDASGPALPKINELTHIEDLAETVEAVGEMGGEGAMSVYSSTI